MKKYCIFMLVLMCAGLFVACEPAATEAELKQMCENLTKVRGEAKVPTVADLTEKLTEEYAGKEKKLLDWKARDMKGWDEELLARQKRLTDNPDETDDAGEPMTPEKLTEIYAKKKEIGAKQFDDDLLKLTVEKKEKLAGLGDIVAAAQKEFDTKTAECLTAAKSEKVSQSLAQCRINAPDKDAYWNKCK
ncbi:MAG: hypothetical protein JXR76_01440 [Deltaproteobacteria bacterium]|nr:hypothetical protein [Deltaproteobacteria bacterium]